MPLFIAACFFSGLQSLLTLHYFFQDHRHTQPHRHWVSYIAASVLIAYMGWLYHFPLQWSVFMTLAWLPFGALMLLWCRPAQSLLLFFLPSLSAQSLTYPLWFRLQSTQAGWLSWLHYYMAIFTCSMLVITALLSAMYALKQLGLKAKIWHQWVDYMPDLQTLEYWVGLTFIYGFTVLTITLMSGILWQWSIQAPLMTTKAWITLPVWVVLALLGFAWHKLKWRGLRVWSVLWGLSAVVVTLFVYSGH